mgnify:CR=1 FL=1
MIKSKKLRLGALFLSVLTLMIGTGGCSSSSSESTYHKPKTLRIATQSSTESQIMGYMLKDLIEHDTNYKVKMVSNLGSSSVSHKALQNNDADIMATSYTGTDLTGTLGMPAQKDPKKATRTVDRLLKERYDEIRYPSYGFADTYAFMVTHANAKKYNLNTVGDLKPVASQLTAGVDSSWMNRKGDGYNDFAKVYGFKFKRVYPMQIGLVYDAAEQGKMQVILGYSTDGRIRSYNLKILKDNLHFFPPYNCSLVVRGVIIRHDPHLKKVLHRLDGKISLSTMQELNYQSDDELLEPATVAHRFLVKHHYFEGGNN